MSERQCPVCTASVEESKAFCPECGAPMDQEAERDKLPEIGSMTKTFNLSADEYQQMLREMNLAVKPEDNFLKTQTIVIAPEIVQEAKEARKKQSVVVEPVAAEKPKSRKTLYILSGSAIFLILILAAAVMVLLYVFRQEILEHLK